MKREQPKLLAIEAGSSLDVETKSTIEQVTQRKLKFVKELLHQKGLAFTGTRDQVRTRIYNAVESNKIQVSDLEELLIELDAWGNQRLRILKLDLPCLSGYKTLQLIEDKALHAGMSALIDAEVSLEPPDELTPMSIKHYRNEDGQIYLLLVAARTRRTEEKQTNIEPKIDPEYPGIKFIPYKSEHQKAVCFAEINLSNGVVIVSIARTKHNSQNESDYEMLMNHFDSFIPLNSSQEVSLWEANRKICLSSNKEVRLTLSQSKTNQGGTIEHRSPHTSLDLRNDPEQTLDSSKQGSHTNCYWEILGNLKETVHTQIYAAKGEIVIMGQIKEDSARHVLRRILELN